MTKTQTASLPKTKMTKWGFLVYLTFHKGKPVYVSIPERD